MRRSHAALAVVAAAGFGLGGALIADDSSSKSSLPAAEAKANVKVPGLTKTGTLPRLRTPARPTAPPSLPPSPAAPPPAAPATPPVAPAPTPAPSPGPAPSPSPPPPPVEF